MEAVTVIRRSKPNPFSSTQSYRPMVYGFPLSHDICRATANRMRLSPVPAGQAESQPLSIQRLEVVKDYVLDRFAEVWPIEKLRYKCCNSDGTRPTISFTDNYAGKFRGARVPVMPMAEESRRREVESSCTRNRLGYEVRVVYYTRAHKSFWGSLCLIHYLRPYVARLGQSLYLQVYKLLFVYLLLLLCYAITLNFATLNISFCKPLPMFLAFHVTYPMHDKAHFRSWYRVKEDSMKQRLAQMPHSLVLVSYF